MLPRSTCIAALILGLSVGVSVAQSLNRAAGPAELPPSSFQGKQFVDSEGCAFIRAGFGDRITWVPRVSRARKILCGFRPTFTSGSPDDVQPPQPVRRVAQPEANPVRQVQRVVKKAPKTQAEAIDRNAPAGQNNRRPRIAPNVKAAGKKVATCVGQNGTNSDYVGHNDGSRCIPQKTSQRTVLKQKDQRRNVLRGPKGVNKRINDTQDIKAPKGYRAVHGDGRLNPLRGVGTAAGKAQMAMIWSNTVPRYLIDPATGKRLK